MFMKQTREIKHKVILIISVIIVIILLVLLGGNIILRNNEIIKKSKGQEENIIQDVNNEKSKEEDIFSFHYEKANERLQTLSLDEKIAQLFVVGTSKNSNLEDLKKYQFGGYLLFKDFFTNKTADQIKKQIDDFQASSKIPLLIAVDEEGGKVVRVSSNNKLRKEAFKSPSQLYEEGGFERIKQDTIEKSIFLENLGINLNYAPVVDISENSNDYMYDRTLQQGKELTSTYAKIVISASKEGKVSYTLKHFPGYGSNKDTHKVTSKDERTLEEIYQNDLEPFRAGIKEGAEVVMVSHNTVSSIDKVYPASLSKPIHVLLRENLEFTGIIITDSINMGAISDNYKTSDAIISAILVGNDMMIISIDKSTTDKITKAKVTYETIIKTVKDAVQDGQITEERINESVKRILAWKYLKGLME